VAGDPQQFHTGKVDQALLSLHQQGLKSLHPGLHFSLHVADHEVAIAFDLQMMDFRIPGELEPGNQGMKFRLVIAAGAPEYLAGLVGLTIRCKEDKADAHLPRIGQGGAIYP